MRLNAAEAAAALRAGSLTAADLVEAAFAAIGRHNPGTNAFISTDEDGARAAAARLDHELKNGVDRGPLHGITLSLKDLIDVDGTVTTAASHVLDDRVAAATAPVVTRLLHAGATVIGRTNLHEFALGTTSEDSAFGPVRNPVNDQRVAGGSSGGSAAAVATGMGIGSIGTDTGGSIRIPAAACGVVGLKPSAGEVAADGVIPLSPTLDHVGPLALTVQDAAWIFDVMAGRVPVHVTARPLKSLRLKRLGGYFAHPVAPEVRAAFDDAIARLAASGVSVIEGTIELGASVAQTYADIVLSEAAHWHRDYLDTRADRYTPRVRERILHGRAVPAVRYLAALDNCGAFRHAVDAALDNCDALVLPTLPLLAPIIGTEQIVIDPRSPEPTAVRAAMLKHTQLFNLSGHPAISLPIATTGLPVGLQLVGRRDRTHDLLGVAAACESLIAHA